MTFIFGDVRVLQATFYQNIRLPFFNAFVLFCVYAQTETQYRKNIMIWHTNLRLKVIKRQRQISTSMSHVDTD